MRFLAVGDWIVACAESGALEVEFALFDASEVVLSAAARGFGTREQGYLTTAGRARARLRDAGLDDAFLRAALESLGRLEDLARTPAIAAVAGRLEASEAFQGATWSAAERLYEGAWLDLAAVARACASEGAARAMQLVHLAAVLQGVQEATPVRLLAGDDEAKPGQRTWRRVETDFIADLPDALRAIERPLSLARVDADELHAARLEDLRVRAELAGVYVPRLHALASALSPPADADIVVEDVELEPSPLIDELREHARMLRGDARLAEVAQFLTALARARVVTGDLAILASRAWLACGEMAYARYFARRAADDETASETARALAGEILGTTPATEQSMNPPPVTPSRPVAPRAPPEGASLPPTERIEIAPRSVHPGAAEIVETMLAPPADTARIRMTELARELARDYRLAYGVTLQTDAGAIEAMQRHLARRAGAATEEELTRHGALLSEILARTLGAYWIDTAPPKVGRWSMIVPPRARVWPIGRVYRFIERGAADGDLVGFYRELAVGKEV